MWATVHRPCINKEKKTKVPTCQMNPAVPFNQTKGCCIWENTYFLYDSNGKRWNRWRHGRVTVCHHRVNSIVDNIHFASQHMAAPDSTLARHMKHTQWLPWKKDQLTQFQKVGSIFWKGTLKRQFPSLKRWNCHEQNLKWENAAPGTRQYKSRPKGNRYWKREGTVLIF
jgi:hypothetical protein